MAKYVNNPNSHSVYLNTKFTRRFFILFSAVCGIALAYWLSQISILFGIMGIVMILLAFLIATKIATQIGKNDRGSTGEFQVREILQKLPDSYTIFQNVPIKNRLDIDFVLVGPAGVWAIEVKSHRGFNVFSRAKFISQTFAEAMGLKNYLKQSGVDVYVQAALVFTGIIVRYSPPKRGVHVLSKDYLLRFLDRAKKHNFDKIRTENLVSNLYQNK